MPNLSAANYGIEEAGGAHAHLFTFTMIIGGLFAIAGIALAYLMHLKDRGLADRVAKALGPITYIVEHKFFVDEIYQACIIEPLRMLGRILFAIDKFIVDGIINLLGWIPQLSGFALKLTVQRGYLQGYATVMLFGIMVILVLIFL